MGEVARIVVPNPPALTPAVDDGVETQGQVYLLHAPSVATEPMVVRAPTGETLRMAAAEMYYRDAADQWDVLYGSAPASVSASGRQARYERPWPLGDDVFVAEAQRVKHYAIIHRAPRRPAAHLGDGTEFGIAWVVSGITLPTGRHDSIEVGPFTLPRPWAQDTAGERVYGYYEVIDVEDDLQQLYLWLPADWLLSEERVYPVTVDPTVVVVSGAYLVGVFHMPKSGHLVALIRQGYNLLAYTSVDQGQTWRPAGTLITHTGSNQYQATVDNDDVLYVTNNYWVRFDYIVGNLVLHTFRYNSSTRIFQQADTYDLSTTDDQRSYGVYGLGVQGAQGSTKTLYILHGYWWSSYSGISGHIRITSHRWNVSTTGALSGHNEYTYFSRPKDMPGWAGTLSVPQSGNARVWLVDHYTGKMYTATHGRSPTEISSIPSPQDGMGINGADIACFLHFDGTSATMVWANGTTTQMGSGYSQAVYRAHDGLFALVGKSGNKLKLRTYNRASGTFSQEIVSLFDVGSEFIIPNAPIRMDSVPVLYRALGNDDQIMYDGLAFNIAPLAPSDLLCPNFDARYPVTFTWRFNDSDSADSQSQYQLEIALGGIVVYDTGPVASPISAHVLPANTLQNGKSYQWRVRTADQSGAWSPWSAWAVVQTSEKPVATIMYPITGAVVNSGEVTVQWSTASQASAVVRLYDATGQTVLQEVQVTTPSARARTITGLENGQSYQVSVQVTSAIGVQGDEAFSGPFSVEYTRPLPAMDVTAVGEAALAAVKLKWRRGWSRPGTFSRSSVAYLPDGTQVGPNQPRYYGGGIMVEERTTNLLTENQSSVEIDLSGLERYSGTTLTRDTTVAWHGAASVKVVTDGTIFGQGVFTSTTATPGTTYTASVYVKAPEGTPLRLRFLAYNGTTFVSDIQSVPFVGTGDWQRVVATGVCPAEANGVRIQVSTTAPVATTFWVDGLQLEAKPYATSWTLGGTTRAAETLTVPTAGLSPQEGCWRQWVYVNAAVRQQVEGRSTRIFQISRGPGAQDYGILLYHSSAQPIWLLYTANDAGVWKAVAADDSLTPDGWHLFEVKWTAARAELWIDGALAAYMNNPNLPSAFTSAYVGCRPDGVFQPNTIFGQTQLLSRCPSDAESLAAYQRGVNNLTWDEHTLALYTWANTVEGGTQEAFFSHWGVERSEDGQEWKRIAAVDNPPEGDWVEYADYAVGSGRPYQYRVVAYGSNGTETKGEPVTASVIIDGGIWLHDPKDPANTAHHFLYHELPSTDRSVIPSGVFQFAGRKLPVVQMDASQMERTVRYRLYLSDETDDRAALEALYERRTTLCLRNHRGKKYYVVFTEMPLEFERRGAWADVEFQVVDFDEEV